MVLRKSRVSQLSIKALQLVEGQLALTAIGDQSLAIVIIPESPAACGWANGNLSVPMGSSLSGSESERRTASKLADNDWLIPCGFPLDAVADSGLPSYQPTSHKHLILSSPEGMPFNETGLS
jgi:hypothetical protein